MGVSQNWDPSSSRAKGVYGDYNEIMGVFSKNSIGIV